MEISQSRMAAVAAKEDRSANDPSSPPPPWPRRIPQCTHMSITRLHGDLLCYHCGKRPSLGFVYVCSQEEQDLRPLLPRQQVVELSKHVLGQSLQAKAYMAEALGMSESIAKQIQAGLYDEEQIETLFSQRRHALHVLQSVVDREENKKDHSDLAQCKEEDACNARQAITVDMPACILQVCHTCKPFVRERMYIDPLTVLERGLEEQILDDFNYLPVHDARILSGLVLPGEAPKATKTTYHRLIRHEIINNTSPTASSQYSEDSSDSDLFPFSFADYNNSTAEHMTGERVREGEGEREREREKVQSGCVQIAESIHDTNQSTPSRTRTQTNTSSFTTETPYSTSDSSSFSLPSPATSALTPLHHNEETFEASFEKKIGTFAESASFCGPFRRGSLCSERPLDAEHNSTTQYGMAVTEESVEPDVISTL